MLNISSRVGKVRYYREFLKQMVRLENIFYKKIKPIQNRQFMNSAKFIEWGSENIDFAVDHESFRLKQELATHYKRVFKIFGNRVFQEFEKSVMGYEKKGLKEDFESAIFWFIRIKVAEKVKQINITTKKIIKRAIKKGIREGKSNRNIAKDIRKAGNINIFRSKRIARTETHSASTYATDSAMGSTKLKMEKEWMSALDSRTRSAHARADGQRVGMKEKFRVGGELLNVPGDPDGSAKNIINCRCVTLYYTEGEV